LWDLRGWGRRGDEGFETMGRRRCLRRESSKAVMRFGLGVEGRIVVLWYFVPHLETPNPDATHQKRIPALPHQRGSIVLEKASRIQ
jgi:hypothetical protein